MIVPRGLADLRRGAPRRRRGLPRAEGAPQGEGPHRPPSATRAASRRASRSNEEAIQHVVARDRGRPATSPARTSPSRSTARASEFFDKKTRAATPSTRSSVTRDELVAIYEALVDEVPASSRSRTAAPRTTGTAGRLLTEQARQEGAARRRRSLRHQRRAPRSAASRAASRTRSSSSSTRSARSPRRSTAIRMAQRARLPLDHLPPLGRDRGHLHRRPRGRDERRADQDRQPLALGPRREVQPAPAHRLRARRAARSTRARARSSRPLSPRACGDGRVARYAAPGT